MKIGAIGIILSFGSLVAGCAATPSSDSGGIDAYWRAASTKQVWKNSTGLCWRAGYWTPAQAIEECDPDLVKKPEPPAAAPAPAPEPKVEPAPLAPPTEAPPAVLLPQKISFSADALFDFDKAILKPDAKSMLDELASTLRGAEYDVILAVGHADRIGSESYNKKLSLRRANAVKEYLVSKGIAENRIYVEGKGEAEPVTTPADCKGLRGNKLIQCLQPDRRVDVEVTGEKPAE
ncbi:MAG: OmpA family protein [Burkholderiales bacterium]